MQTNSQHLLPPRAHSTHLARAVVSQQSHPPMSQMRIPVKPSPLVTQSSTTTTTGATRIILTTPADCGTLVRGQTRTHVRQQQRDQAQQSGQTTAASAIPIRPPLALNPAQSPTALPIQHLTLREGKSQDGGMNSSVDERAKELESALQQVDDYCRNYISHLSEELLQSTGGVNGVKSKSIVPTVTPTSIVAAAAAAAAANTLSGNPLVTSIQSILSHPSHAPTAIPRIQALRPVPNSTTSNPTSARKPSIASIVVETSPKMKASEKKKGTKKVKQESETEDADAEMDEDVKEEVNEDGTEDEDMPEPSSESDEDEEYSPRTRGPTGRSGTSRKRGADVLSSMFSGGRSSSGRQVKRKISDEEVHEDEDDESYEDDGDEDENESSRKRRTSRDTESMDDGQKQRRSKLPLRAVMSLRQFFIAHIEKPFPKDQEKRELAEECNLNFKQVSDWFTNTRKRFWRPYTDHLNNVGCILATNAWAICKCGTRSAAAAGGNKKKQKRGKSTSAEAAAAVAAAMDEEEEDGEELNGRVPEHAWIKMWN